MIIALAGYASAQTVGHASHQAAAAVSPAMHVHNHALITTQSGKTMLAGGIDGAVTPELISDSIAYGLFLSAMAEPLNATPEQQRRQRAKLARAQLAEPDLRALLPVLADFQQRNQALEQSFQGGTASTASASLDAQRAELVSAAREWMKMTVTPDGVAKLDSLIQTEKRHMVIYPYPKMP